MKADFSR